MAAIAASGQGLRMMLNNPHRPGEIAPPQSVPRIVVQDRIDHPAATSGRVFSQAAIRSRFPEWRLRRTPSVRKTAQGQIGFIAGGTNGLACHGSRPGDP